MYASNDGMFSKSFLISAITVTLCSLWPTLINTALGVASIDKDLVSVSRVLKMNTWTQDHQAGSPVGPAVDLYWSAPVLGCGLDGSDRG